MSFVGRWRSPCISPEKTIWIKNDELIVGNQASQLRAAPIFPEYTVTWIEQEIDGLADRPDGGFAVSDEAKRAIHKICPFWRGQTVHDRSYGLFTDEHKRILASTLMKIEGNMNAGDGHLAVDYEKALELGLDGVKSVVAKRRHEVDLADWQGLKAEQFLKAVAITLDAVSAYIERYAALAAEMAADEPRRMAAERAPSDRGELRADCSRTPAHVLASSAAVLLPAANLADRIERTLRVVRSARSVPISLASSATSRRRTS